MSKLPADLIKDLKERGREDLIPDAESLIGEVEAIGLERRYNKMSENQKFDFAIFMLHWKYGVLDKEYHVEEK
jgi:hypothetical protein